MRSIFKACDVRGVYGRELTEEKVCRIGAAVATLLRRRGRPACILVGGDVRVSTPSLKAALVAGLTECGAECLDLGTVPTPVFYFARQHLGVPAGVMVTASHNPASHNGLKLVLGELPVTPEDLGEIRGMAEAGDFEKAPGSAAVVSVADAYARHLLEATAPWHAPSKEAPRIVVDPGGGCWSRWAASLLRDAGYPALSIHDTPDGRFPFRDPNPSVPEHLQALREAVVAEGAGLGVAFDGDGDRVAFVDERGRALPADETAILLIRHLVPGEPGARVAHDIKCSQAVADEVRRCGGVPLMERSGHTFLKTRMIRENALFGPEASGHYFFRALSGGDDGLYCALILAGLVARAGAPLSELARDLPRYATTSDIRVRHTGDPTALLERIAASFPGESVCRLDGVRVQFPEGWGLIRPSVTEAALTLRFEGRTSEALRRVVQEFVAVAPELGPWIEPFANPSSRPRPGSTRTP
ncbi:MAG: phosphomannomutase/phosphoglucomutase [Armatimonadetes bacterium]|nr:phosphomannomutase/phosphoglucomutase [Armatimonadota bacterium]